MNYEIGTKVKIVKAIDETCLPEQVGKTGTIVQLNINGMTGNYENCPLYIVDFDDASLSKDSFWNEELEKII